MEQIPGDDPDSFDPSGKRITKMRICKEGNGLWATTHYEAVLQDPFWAVVCCRLETGRTHQIRVHLTGEDLPLIGDQLYRGRAPGIAVKMENLLDFHRQALHASRLGLVHPVTGEEMQWFREPPEDMIQLMDDLGFGPWDRPVTVFERV